MTIKTLERSVMFDRIERDNADIILGIAKRLVAQHKRKDKIHEKLSHMNWQNTREKQLETTKCNLDEAIHELDVISAELHAACVDAGIADLRDQEHYQKRYWYMGGMHKFLWTPVQPKILLKDTIGNTDSKRVSLA